MESNTKEMKVKIKPKEIEVVKDDEMYFDPKTLTYYTKDDVEVVEPETEFEKALADIIGYAISVAKREPDKPTAEFAKGYAGTLLDLARKDLPRWKTGYECGSEAASAQWLIKRTGPYGLNDYFVSNRVFCQDRFILIEDLEKILKEDKK